MKKILTKSYLESLQTHYQKSRNPNIRITTHFLATIAKVP